jgi:hypothetical protein
VGPEGRQQEYSVPLAVKLGEKVTAAGSEAVVGDCHLANTAIDEQTGAGAVHPLNIVARAYGIPEND